MEGVFWLCSLAFLLLWIAFVFLEFTLKIGLYTRGGEGTQDGKEPKSLYTLGQVQA